MDTTDQLHVYIAGRVQGVGFRYSTITKARSIGLTGWVRNCGDGRVEALFQGPKTTLDEMHKWCHQGPTLANVKNVETTWDTAPPQFQSFDMTY